MDNSLFQGKLVTSRRIIYTPSDFARTNLIHLQEIGSLQALRPHTYKPEGKPVLLSGLPCPGRKRNTELSEQKFPAFKGRLRLSRLQKTLLPPFFR